MVELSHAWVLISPPPPAGGSGPGAVNPFGIEEERGEVKQFICPARSPARGRKWPRYRYLASGGTRAVVAFLRQRLFSKS